MGTAFLLITDFVDPSSTNTVMGLFVKDLILNEKSIFLLLFSG